MSLTIAEFYKKTKDKLNRKKNGQDFRVGSIFPIKNNKQELNNNGILVLFLSTSCLLCLDILSMIKEIKDDLGDKDLILFIKGGKNELRSLDENIFASISNYYLIKDTRKYNVKLLPYFLFIKRRNNSF